MLYPTRFQVRYSTVLVIVLLLMGSVLYEVTRSESAGREDAARTQDIALPAVQPVEHKIRGSARPDYIGRSSFSAASTMAANDGDVAIAAGTAGTAGTSIRGEAVGQTRTDAPGNSGNAPGRVRSASSSGYAPGSYGMGGVGAWGGASGMVRASATATAAAPGQVKKAAKGDAPPKAPKPSRPGSTGSGGAPTTGTSGEVLGTLFPAEGFSTGAAAVEPGAVATVASNGRANGSPAGSPASTPEPMSMLLMGTGLVALYGVRRRFQ